MQVPLRAAAGTAIIYDVSLFHARADPTDAAQPSHRRRTMHMYIGRPEGPPLVGWALLPRRLAERRAEPFFSVLAATPMARLFEAKDFSVRALAGTDPDEIGSALGGESWVAHMRGFVEGWGGDVSGAHQEARLPHHLC